jgi:hypothetical protein
MIMAMRTGPYREWVRETRRPNPPPPRKSCDCQFHIYGDPSRYPPSAAATYPPINATFSDAVAMHQALGFERGVIVHSSIYGGDHRLLLDTLENLDPALRGRYRATSIIDDSVSDQELERLNAAGVCAARLNIAKMFGVTPSQSAAQRTIERIRGLGWHVRVHVRGNDLLEFSDVLKSVREIPMVIDHLGHVAARDALGDDHDQLDAVLDRLEDGVLGERGRDGDDGAVDRRAVVLDRLGDGVEHRHPVDLAAEPAGRDAADDLRAGAVVEALARQVHGLAAGDALDDERRVFVDEDAHGYASTASLAASCMEVERSA